MGSVVVHSVHFVNVIRSHCECRAVAMHITPPGLASTTTPREIPEDSTTTTTTAAAARAHAGTDCRVRVAGRSRGSRSECRGAPASESGAAAAAAAAARWGALIAEQTMQHSSEHSSETQQRDTQTAIAVSETQRRGSSCWLPADCNERVSERATAPFPLRHCHCWGVLCSCCYECRTNLKRGGGSACEWRRARRRVDE